MPPEWEALWRLGVVELVGSYSIKYVFRIFETGRFRLPIPVVNICQLRLHYLEQGTDEARRWTGDEADERFREFQAKGIHVRPTSDAAGVTITRICDKHGRTVTSQFTCDQ